jgi:hypothetical protein
LPAGEETYDSLGHSRYILWTPWGEYAKGQTDVVGQHLGDDWTPGIAEIATSEVEWPCRKAVIWEYYLRHPA